MTAKKLYQKHLKRKLDWHNGRYLSPKQMSVLIYEASINAIEEALTQNK